MKHCDAFPKITGDQVIDSFVSVKSEERDRFRFR